MELWCPVWRWDASGTRDEFGTGVYSVGWDGTGAVEKAVGWFTGAREWWKEIWRHAGSEFWSDLLNRVGGGLVKVLYPSYFVQRNLQEAFSEM